MKSIQRIGPAVAAVLLASHVVSAQSTKSEAKARPSAEMASGVIVKSEPVAQEGNASPKRVRLTFNTAVVWRDWSRDQASLTQKTTAQAAADGKNSVGTAGQPVSSENLVTVEITPETKMEVRYRSPTDEISGGAKTPDGAAKAEAGTDAADTTATKPEVKKTTASDSVAKPPKYSIQDLKPGLWIEVDYRRVATVDRATAIRVIRPVGGPQIPAAAEKPTTPK